MRKYNQHLSNWLDLATVRAERGSRFWRFIRNLIMDWIA